MSISAKMISGDSVTGPKIYISFPVGFSNHEALNITEELNKYLSVKTKNAPAMWGSFSHNSDVDIYKSYFMEDDTSENILSHLGSRSNNAAAPVDANIINEKTPAEKANDNKSVMTTQKDWPTQGYVTINEIVNYWTIGRSSFLDRVRKGIFSKSIQLKNRAHNAPKVWEAAVIGKELSTNGYVRRAQ